MAAARSTASFIATTYVIAGMLCLRRLLATQHDSITKLIRPSLAEGDCAYNGLGLGLFLSNSVAKAEKPKSRLRTYPQSTASCHTQDAIYEPSAYAAKSRSCWHMADALLR